jgi:hypothetical protein
MICYRQGQDAPGPLARDKPARDATAIHLSGRVACTNKITDFRLRSMFPLGSSVHAPNT